MRDMRNLASGLLGALLFTGCTVGPTDLEEIIDPVEEIRREVQLSGIPSLAAGVVHDGSLVWQGHFGLADLSEQRPANERTIYRVASVSKTVVATAVLQLVERGHIELDADVNTYFAFDVRNPRYPDRPVTALHLLTHTSGLNWPESNSEIPGFYKLYSMDSAPALGEWLPELLLPDGALYIPAVWMDSEPGQREYYSNIGTALLAHLVEVVSGLDFNDYCKAHIFAPLQMSSTSYAFGDLDMSEVATHYGPQGRALPLARHLGYPAGDLKTTIYDFSRLMAAYLNGGRLGGARILQSSSVEAIFTRRNDASGIGLIWIESVGGWFGHAGGDDGVSAYMEIQPESGVGLMIVTNTRHPMAYPGSRTHALVRRIARQHAEGGDP